MTKEACSASIDSTAIVVAPDLRVLLFTMVVSALAGVFFGVVPAMGVTRTDLTPRPQRPNPLNRRGRWGVRWGRALVVSQTALSVVLLIAAALFVQSLVKLYSLDAGYDRENVLVAKIETRGIGLEPQSRPGQDGYREAEAKIQAFYRRMIDGLSNMPDVEAAAVSRVAVAIPIRNWRLLPANSRLHAGRRR